MYRLWRVQCVTPYSAHTFNQDDSVVHPNPTHCDPQIFTGRGFVRGNVRLSVRFNWRFAIFYHWKKNCGTLLCEMSFAELCKMGKMLIFLVWWKFGKRCEQVPWVVCSHGQTWFKVFICGQRRKQEQRCISSQRTAKNIFKPPLTFKGTKLAFTHYKKHILLNPSVLHVYQM